MAFRFADGDILRALRQSLIPICFQGVWGRAGPRPGAPLDPLPLGNGHVVGLEM